MSIVNAPPPPPKEHHGREYAIGAVGALMEYLAVTRGISWLAWFAGFLFWLAFYEYTKHRLWNKPVRYGAWALLAVAIGIGTFALTRRNVSSPSVHSTPPSVTVAPKEHHAQLELSMTEWGSAPHERIFSVVKVEPPQPNNVPFRLLLIARVVDNTIDEMEDTQIEKSTSRSLSGQTIELVMSQKFLERAYQLKWVKVILVILPATVEASEISKLSDVTRLGGQITVYGGFTPRINKIIRQKGNGAPFRPTI